MANENESAEMDQIADLSMEIEKMLAGKSYYVGLQSLANVAVTLMSDIPESEGNARKTFDRMIENAIMWRATIMPEDPPTDAKN